MEAQITQCGNKGMFQDISISKATNEFAYENYNIRITAINDSTLFSITNEKLPSKVTNTLEIEGEFLGSAMLGDYIVLFTHASNKDYIYRLTLKEDTADIVTLYSGNLKFKNQIETLSFYESEDVQKVYWVDGENQLRFINIVSSTIKEDNDFQFDVNPLINGTLNVEITKDYSGAGIFNSGIIQYFITYYNKFGAETNVAWTSPLEYINFKDRGASPEEVVNCEFKLEISNLDINYTNLRVYSIHRTSLNGEPKAKLVADVEINNQDVIIVRDTNNNQETIDASSLLFMGGEELIPKTLTQKDNTLFIGNVKSNNVVVKEDISELRELNPSTQIIESKYITFFNKLISKAKDNGYYDFEQETLNSSLDVKTYKSGETYRFGIQFQTPSGVWTSPEWIGDKVCNTIPYTYTQYNAIAIPDIEFTLPESLKLKLKDKYINYRLLMAETNINNRSIIAQGVVSPTVFNYKDRCENKVYSTSSWIMRPRGGNANYEHLDNTGTMYYVNSDGTIELGDSTVEIQGTVNKEAPTITAQSTGEEYITIGLLRGNKIVVASGVKTIKEGTTQMNELCRFSIDASSWKNAYNRMIEKAEELNIAIDNLSYDAFRGFIDYGPDSEGYIRDTNDKWTNTNIAGVPCHNWLLTSSSITSNKYVLSTVKSVSEAYDVLADINNKKNNFYIDSSILTFHSPDLEDLNSTISNLKFRLVGLVPITGSYSDIEASIEPGYFKEASLNKDKIINTPNINTGASSLISDFLYTDYGLTTYESDSTHIIDASKIRNYKLYMWNKQGNIVVTNDSVTNIADFPNTASKLNRKIIGNLRFSAYTSYLGFDWKSDISGASVFDSDSVELKKLNLGFKEVFYSGNYNKLLSFTNDEAYHTVVENEVDSKIKVFDPVRIKYKSTPHAVFALTNADKSLNVLPRLEMNEEDSYSLNSMYENIGDSTYAWGDVEYKYSYISGINCIYPYLYMGELYRDIPYDTLYGGTSESALQQIVWLPISKATPIEDTVNMTEGDTYYQRWDCLKTYPYTEEDLNSVVDITSFMVESHKNLEGRYDKNRGISNLLNVRPSNFNLFNEVYSQNNNFFSYNILDSKFDNTEYTNQIVFSLEKIPTSNIDVWANLSTTNALNLDGDKGSITKLFNLNDSILAFQEKGISTINFNTRTMLSTEGGIPVEIANSGKVNGYTYITSSVGCQNKQSICLGEGGLYFIDDYNQSFYKLNKEGLSNLSQTLGMSMWFKENLTGNEKTVYDVLHKDVYVINYKCLNYNEYLNSFISFYPYTNTKELFCVDGESYLFDSTNTFNRMFNGDYTSNYHIQFKINPEPLADKIFTNIEYIADCIPESIKIDNKGLNTNNRPFDTLKVWNEYQEGTTNLLNVRYPKDAKKFRIWRIDIPRDSTNKKDRIRNPWIYLKLSNSTNNKDKMVFHNLLVKYYK